MDIIGRDRELAALRETIRRPPGVPPNLVLHGDPGVGKTVLLRAAIGYAEQRGVRVLGGTGYESEAQMAFAGLYQLFAPVLDHLDRVEPFHRDVLRRVLGFQPGPIPDRLAISVASLAVLASVAEDGPVLIAVEDAHWVDHPTREVVMFLLLRLQPYDIRAIFARRPLTSTERVTPASTCWRWSRWRRGGRGAAEPAPPSPARGGAPPGAAGRRGQPAGAGRVARGVRHRRRGGAGDAAVRRAAAHPPGIRIRRQGPVAAGAVAHGPADHGPGR
ncbi:ATP-binding protein [Streptosporangium lutulentum]